LLKASTAYCDPLVSVFTETTMTELTTVGQVQMAKGLVPASLITHDSRRPSDRIS